MSVGCVGFLNRAAQVRILPGAPEFPLRVWDIGRSSANLQGVETVPRATTALLDSNQAHAGYGDD
jgi:hypothetical protein